MKKRIKIAQTIPSFLIGGLHAVAIMIANGLADAGYAVDLLVMRDEGLMRGEVSPRVRVVTYPPDEGKGRWAGRVAIVERYLREERPDVVIGNGMIAGAVQAAHARADSASKLIVVSHGEPQRGAFSRLVDLISPHRVAERRAAHRASAAVGVSRGLTDNALGIYPPEIRRTIYNPVIIPSRRAHAIELADHPSLKGRGKNSPPTVVTVGRIDIKQKAQDTLLRAFKLMLEQVDARLVIVGGGPAREVDRLKKIAISSNISEKIDFVGPQSDPFSYMAGADLFVLSSNFEGFGLVLIEAMYCGTPIVSTDCPHGPREILLDGELGVLVPVGNARALADAMARELLSPRSDEHCERLRRRAMEFDDTNAVKGYSELIEELTRESRP